MSFDSVTAHRLDQSTRMPRLTRDLAVMYTGIWLRVRLFDNKLSYNLSIAARELLNFPYSRLAGQTALGLFAKLIYQLYTIVDQQFLLYLTKTF